MKRGLDLSDMFILLFVAMVFCTGAVVYINLCGEEKDESRSLHIVPEPRRWRSCAGRIVILLLFGGKGIPSVAKTLGKAVREFKDAASGVQRDIRESTGNITETYPGPYPGSKERNGQGLAPDEAIPILYPVFFKPLLHCTGSEDPF